MRRVALLLIPVLALAGCGFGAPAPTSVGFNLKNGQVDVALDQPIVFNFSRAVAATPFLAHLTLLPSTSGDLAMSTDFRTATFTPTKAWAEKTAYQVKVATFKDTKGNPVTGRQWTFTTTIVPRVVGVKDDAGHDLSASLEVEQGSKVSLDFNTPMAPADTAVTANGQPATLAWAADGLSASIPTASLPVGPLVLALASGKDTAGHVAQSGWSIALDVAYTVHIATTHLPFPALVQIPNDGYGARPQVGIQAAAMVFEYQTEGGIQRLTALYTDVPAVVGPTRSGRRISFRLVRHYHGNLFLSGLSDDAHRFLASDPVPAWFDNPPGFYRDPGRVAPNNLMLRGDAVLADEQASGTPAFEPLKPGKPGLGTATPAATFGVDEHRSSYAYDPVTGTYTKVEDGDTMTDASLNKPDQIFMVLVMHAREFLVPDIENGCCTHGRDFDLDAGGALDIYYRGQHAAGSWSAADRSTPFVFKNAAGAEVTLPPGLVWVDVVGN